MAKKQKERVIKFKAVLDAKGIISDIKSAVSDAEKEGKIQLTADDKEIQASIKKLMDMVDSDLKGINLTKQFKQLANFLSEPVRELEKFKGLMAGLEEDFQGIYEISKRTKSAELFNSKQLDSLLEVYAKIGEAKKTLEKAKATAEESANKMRLENRISVVDSTFKDAMERYNIKFDKGADVGTVLGLSDDQKKQLSIELRDYKALVELYQKIGKESSTIGKPSDLKEAQKKLTLLSEQYSVIKEIERIEKNLVTKYETDAEKLWTKTELNGATAKSDLGKRNHASSQYQKFYLEDYEKRVAKAQVNFDSQVQKFSEKIAEKAGKNLDGVAERLEKLAERIARTKETVHSDDGEKNIGGGLFSDDDVNNISKYLVSLDECINKINELEKKAKSSTGEKYNQILEEQYKYYTRALTFDSFESKIDKLKGDAFENMQLYDKDPSVLSDSAKTMIDKIWNHVDAQIASVESKTQEVVTEIEAGTESFSTLLSNVSKLNASLINSGKRMEEHIALLDNYGKVLSKETGSENVSAIKMVDGARKLFHTHPFSDEYNNLRFSDKDMETFFRKAVPQKITESILYCGDQLLSLDVTNVPTEKLRDLQYSLLGSYYTVMYQMGNAVLDEEGFDFKEANFEKLGSDFNKEFTKRLNATMKEIVESYGGSFTSQLYPTGEINKSAFDSNIIDTREAAALSTPGMYIEEIEAISKKFSELRKNFQGLQVYFGEFNLPDEELYRFAEAITDGKIGFDKINASFVEIQDKLAQGLPVEKIISDLIQLQKQADATEKAVEEVAAENARESKNTIPDAGSSPVQNTTGIKTYSGDAADIQNEIEAFKKFDDVVGKVKSSVDEKSNAVKSEEDIVHNAVSSEISYFEKLRDMIDNVSGSLHAFLAQDDDADSNGSERLFGNLKAISEVIEKINEIRLDESLFKQFENIPSFKNLDDFTNAILAFRESMKDIGSLGNNENFFDGFKISKSSVNNIADLATALDLIKDSLDGFGPEARNALSSLEVIAKNTKVLQQVKAPDQSGESSGKPKKPVAMEDTIRDAWKQAELEDVKRTEGAYDSLIGKLTKYTNLVSKKASGKPFTTQEAKDFANLSEQINKAISKQGIYATTTEQAEAANRRFNTELEKMKQLYSETAVANYDKRFEGFKAQESDKIPQYADALKEMEESLARIKKLSPVDLFDEAAMKEYSHEVESFEKLAVDLKSKKYNFVPDDKKHTVISNFESWANQNTAALRQYGDEIERVRSLFNNIVSPADLDEATSAFKRLQAEVNRTGKVGKSFADIWKSRIQSLFVYLSSFVSFYDAIGVLRQGFDVIKDYDTALTEMQKVSDASYKSLKDFQEASFALGNTVGSTGKQIQNSTADFLRLGESFEEAKKSAIDANTLFKVSEFGTIEEATDAMISMSQAYKELKKSEINDILNNVGNNFSISTEGLATALQTSAAALKVAGNDINEAVALITAGNAIVQDPSQVGAGMRTISLRILGTEQAKDELASLGEDVEDFVVQTASKIDETVKAYTAVASNQFKGVSLLDDNGNYRDTYEILQDIADVYQEILETDKKAGTNRGQALIELLAGKNRANIAASILSNPDLLRDVYETSLDSAGSAQAELDKYLASIEAHLEKVRNQWESIWITDKNREIINFFLDATAAVLQFAEAVGLLPIASGAGGLALFVKNFGRSVKDCIKLPKFFMLADCR